MRLTDGGLVLLVVDMQNGFLGRRSQHVLSHVVRLVQEAKRRSIPIVFTRFHNESNSQYERLIHWSRLRSSPEIDLHSDLQMYASEIIDKGIYSAFTPKFDALIEKNRWTSVAICGVATDGCVLKTAVDTFERGMVPLVISDACASHAGEEVHKAGLMLLERFIGKEQLCNAEEFLSRIDREQGLPQEAE